MRKTAIRLADGRELIYYDEDDGAARETHDRRPLQPVTVESEVRYDAVMDEWVVVASHRQDRTYLPPAELCPLCPGCWRPRRGRRRPRPRWMAGYFARYA